LKNIDSIEAYFTRSDGQYIFARWGRPIAPVVFGVQDETLVTLKAAIQSMVFLANHELVETDPELGSNAVLPCKTLLLLKEYISPGFSLNLITNLSSCNRLPNL